jgi:FixJ family two-component response regulator
MVRPGTESVKPRIAVVDDDDAVCTALVRLIRTARCEVDGFDSAEAFLAARARYDCIILDAKLPGLSGMDLEAQMRAAGDATPIVFITGGGEAEVREIARRTGRPSLGKPVDGIQLLIAVALAVQPVT